MAYDVERPENVGSLFRLADALGVERLHLLGRTVAPPHPKLRRVARATERVVPFEHAPDGLTALDALGELGFVRVALELTSQSEDVRSLEALDAPRIALVLGGERHGIPPEALARCERAVHVPMCGLGTSMNVVSAAAIALFAAGRRFYPQPPVS